MKKSDKGCSKMDSKLSSNSATCVRNGLVRDLLSRTVRANAYLYPKNDLENIPGLRGMSTEHETGYYMVICSTAGTTSEPRAKLTWQTDESFFVDLLSERGHWSLTPMIMEHLLNPNYPDVSSVLHADACDCFYEWSDGVGLISTWNRCNSLFVPYHSFLFRSVTISKV